VKVNEIALKIMLEVLKKTPLKIPDEANPDDYNRKLGEYAAQMYKTILTAIPEDEDGFEPGVVSYVSLAEREAAIDERKRQLREEYGDAIDVDETQEDKSSESEN